MVNFRGLLYGLLENSYLVGHKAFTPHFLIKLQGALRTMDNMKITFPKLKSQSTHQSGNFSTKSRTLNTISTEQPTQYGPSLTDRLQQLKYQYVNKSPSYFKHRNLSQHFRQADGPHQSIQQFLAEQKRGLDKSMLLELARSRVRKLQLQHREKIEPYPQPRPAQGFGDSNYGNFRVMRFQPERALKHIVHPDLSLPFK